ncbi:hypothetical protein PIB30_075054 [Stylosanthes scabra]|uniref:Uncharacterized protein n=1 Tax=Stylosanthes scabra TaxID=79078 RepID=A0ABU6WN48_9FABA|nr:hypothetical protein [Stylosanthes scabra]
MEVDTMDALLAQNKAISQQLNTLNKKIEKLEVAAMGTQTETPTCGLCGGNQNPKYNNFQHHPPYQPFQRPPLQPPPFPQPPPLQPKPPQSNSFEAALENLTVTTLEFVQKTNIFIEETRTNLGIKELPLRTLKPKLVK